MLLDKAKQIFIKRENLIEKYVEDEGTIFYDRLEQIDDKFIKGFCAQAICCAIGDAYDFFCYIQGDNNIFYKNIEKLDSKMGRKIYKWISLYHTICYDEHDSAHLSRIHKAMAFVFQWSKHDFKLLNKYRRIREDCDAQFEAEFTKKMCSDIFKLQHKNPVILALAGNLFYNSRNSFLSEVEVLKIAL